MKMYLTDIPGDDDALRPLWCRVDGGCGGGGMELRGRKGRRRMGWRSDHVVTVQWIELPPDLKRSKINLELERSVQSQRATDQRTTSWNQRSLSAKKSTPERSKITTKLYRSKITTKVQRSRSSCEDQRSLTSSFVVLASLSISSRSIRSPFTIRGVPIEQYGT